MTPQVNQKVLIPRRGTRLDRLSKLDGLDDLLDDFYSATNDLGTSYAWLGSAKNAIQATGSSYLMSSWRDLLMRGEELRARAAKLNLDPSITGFIQNLIGPVTNIPMLGYFDRLTSTDLAVYVGDAQKYVSDVSQLKLAVDQYNRMVASGVSQSDAVNAIDQANQSIFSKITSSLAMPAAGLGLVAVAALVFFFLPEIKAGISVLRKRK